MDWISGKAGLQGEQEADAQEETQTKDGGGEWRDRFAISGRFPTSQYCLLCSPLSYKTTPLYLEQVVLCGSSIHATVYYLERKKCSDLYGQMPLDWQLLDSKG